MRPVVFFWLCFFLIGCKSEERSPDPSGPIDSDGKLRNGVKASFYDLMGMVHASYSRTPSAQDSEQRAAVIAIGRVTDVLDGRIIRHNLPYQPYDVPYAVLVLEPRKLLKGSAHEDGRVYFELMYPGVVGLENLRENLPRHDVLVFANISGWDPTPRQTTTEYLHFGRGFPSGAPELILGGKYAWLVEENGRVVQPMERDPSVQLYDAETLDQISDAIEAGTSETLYAKRAEMRPDAGSVSKTDDLGEDGSE